MTLKEQIAALFELQEVDERIALRGRELAGLNAGEAERERAEEAVREVAAAQQRLHVEERDMLDAELRMKSLEEKKRDYEQKMYGGTVRNPKELQDMEREVDDQLKPNIDRLETKVLQLMEDIERDKAALSAAKDAAEQARVEWERVTGAHSAANAGITGELQQLRADRERRAADVPAELARRYEDLRHKRGGTAVVKVFENGLCAGCRLALAADLVQMLTREDRLFSCESCGRILLWAGPVGD